jgi:uracil-DNA glycosylase
MEQTPSAANVQIEASWKQVLAAEFEQPYFAAIKTYLMQEKQAGKTIYPPGPLIFNAFNQTPFDAVKVVILGQDPYHNPGEAMGLSFSVPKGVKVRRLRWSIFLRKSKPVWASIRPATAT